jgi:class 3 adenylate cyclase/tetratricopeptide (TPR) repeat protein
VPDRRKTVTVLFCDLVDSTSMADELDPEVLRPVLERYFELVSEIVEGHGGSVEKFIGDAVMAVFGIPQLHEDDALRAVRAAAQIRSAVESLSDRGVAIRIGVNTGEVLTRAGELVPGNATNVAARLEQAAAPGEIVLADTTWYLVGHAARAEPRDFELKGKVKPLRAWLLEELLPGTPIERRADAPLIGRTRELDQLVQAFERTTEESTVRLFTLLGPAGIGKSRLAAELLSRAAGRTTALVGRCLPYGDGITYWPLIEILRQLGEQVSTALTEEQEGPAIAAQLEGIVGRAEASATREEVFWSVRKLFEALARRGPLIVVFEDIHWGEPTLLDLIEYITDLARDSPLFVLCIARPEFLDERPGWAGGKLNADSVLLSPLSEVDAEALIDELLRGASLSESARHRIADTAEGNPLFVEQLLAMVSLGEAAGDEPDVPPTIQALLAARLDLLGAEERAVVEAASVIGKEFWLEAVAELFPTDTEQSLTGHLDSLVRKELVRPARSPFFSSDGYRFRHILIRDAAYRAIPKTVRAELHERFADWLQTSAEADHGEYDELLGHHLELAARYRIELDPTDAEAPELARRAAESLLQAAQRARGRDWVARGKLLNRAVDLLPAEHPSRPAALVALGESLRVQGEFGASTAALEAGAEAASAAGESHVEALASIFLAANDNSTHPSDEAATRLLTEAQRAIPALEAAGTALGLAIAWRFISFVRLLSLEMRSGAEAAEAGLRYAREAPDRIEEILALDNLGYALADGPTPIGDAIRRAEELLSGASPWVTNVIPQLSMLYAVAGRLEEAATLLEQAIENLRELGRAAGISGPVRHLADVKRMEGDLTAAEEHARVAYSLAKEVGQTYAQAGAASALARLLFEQGRLDDADRWCRTAEELGSKRRGGSQVDRRLLRAQLLARLGAHEPSFRLAREVVAEIERTDALPIRAESLISYADVLEVTGRPDERVPH